MVDVILSTATIFMALGVLLTMVRFFNGPGSVNRVVSFDVITIISISLIVLISHFMDRAIYLDVAIVYSLLSFLGVLVIARYLEKGL